MFNKFLHHNYDPSFDDILDEEKKNVCENYLEGIYWTTHYYFNECLSWKWYYPHHFSPLLSDLHITLEKFTTFDNLFDNLFGKTPYLPAEQLSIVLPKKSHNLLQDKRYLLQDYMYPTKTPLSIFMKRYLLKLSGEALIGKYEYGIDPAIVDEISSNIVEVSKTENQLAVVVGGGNIFRGAGLAEAGLDRVTGDNIGMLATVINSLALQDAIEKLGTQCRVMSAVRINQITEDYIRRRAIRHLEKKRVVIFAAGTGNPFFTTDSAGCLRAIETQSDVMLKATRVDGVYSDDPEKVPDATFYSTLTYDEAIQKNLKVMDATALTLARDHQLPLKVFNLNHPDALKKIACGEEIGTLIS